MSSVEAPVGGSIALSPAAVGGRRGRSSKKLKLVKKKTVRRMLKKLGMKMRGGAGADAVVTSAPVADAVKAAADAPAAGGRRHRRRSGKSSKKAGLFGMRY
jgi:hypothetical protein